MRVLTLLGSPRANGNTSHVLNWVEQTLRSEAHSVERITLIQHKIGPCLECGACRKEGADLCQNKGDDVDAILHKMLKADVIIWASPVFCWGFPSHTKALMDRMYCLVDDHTKNPEYSTKLAGKPMALLLTSGGPEEGNAELVIRAFYAMTRFLKAIPAGHLLYPFFRTPLELNQRDRTRATEFALHVVAEAEI